ncbi:MAG: TIGR04086 family membrane protein [Clostridia bacterium]|nr:TIGR04086 family membrane protein [Clostridia bacterium]
MKGIVKGTLFSLISIAVIASAAAAISLFAEIPDAILKTVLWSMAGLCVFIGSLLVSKGAQSYKSLRGIISAAATILGLLTVSSVANKGIPSNGGFYTLALIAAICGILGALMGSRQG